MKKRYQEKIVMWIIIVAASILMACNLTGKAWIVVAFIAIFAVIGLRWSFITMTTPCPDCGERRFEEVVGGNAYYENDVLVRNEHVYQMECPDCELHFHQSRSTHYFHGRTDRAHRLYSQQDWTEGVYDKGYGEKRYVT